jgi:hypothetical protein
LTSIPWLEERSVGKHADLQTLIVAHDLGLPLAGRVLSGAISAGRMVVVQYLLNEQHCPLPPGTVHAAGESGSLDMLRFLREKGCRLDGSACADVASRGHLSALKYLHETNCEWWEDSVVGHAAESGNLDMIKWLLQQEGVLLNPDTMAHAAAEGHTAVCAYLLSQQCPWDSTAWDEAALGKHHETLQWLHSNGCPCDVPSACENAAIRGCIDTIELVLQLHSTSLSELSASQLTQVLNAAGTFGQLAAAKWLRQQGADWPVLLEYRSSTGTIDWAPETLAWARAEGCTSPTPW